MANTDRPCNTKKYNQLVQIFEKLTLKVPDFTNSVDLDEVAHDTVCSLAFDFTV